MNVFESHMTSTLIELHHLDGVQKCNNRSLLPSLRLTEVSRNDMTVHQRIHNVRKGAHQYLSINVCPMLLNVHVNVLFMYIEYTERLSMSFYFVHTKHRMFEKSSVDVRFHP